MSAIATLALITTTAGVVGFGYGHCVLVGRAHELGPAGALDPRLRWASAVVFAAAAGAYAVGLGMVFR